MGNAALKGTVERRIYADDATGFAILTIKLADDRKGASVSIKGRGLSGFKPGQGISATGYWVKDARYGEQFMAQAANETIPVDTAGMARWLEQVGVPGIGAVTARKIAQAFGGDAVQRIAEGHPDAKALLGRKFDDAQKAMTERYAEREFGPLLARHGIGKSRREKIFEKYGLDTARIIQEDPYRLIRDVDGIAFKIADDIAHATGTASNDRSRVKAAAIDALRHARGDGHTAVTQHELGKSMRARLGDDVDSAIIDAVVADIDDEAAIATTLMRNGVPVHAWALASVDAAENAFAEAVLDKVEQRAFLTVGQAQRFVDEAIRRMNAKRRKDDKVELNEQQHAACIMALTSGLSILTGGPGTGKTFTLDVIAKAWMLASRERLVPKLVSLAAPTGKASQRMKEATGIEAKTLHRLLEAKGDGFRRDRSNPLETALVAIDETSMKDIWLALAFSRAWGRCPVLLIGDPDQLASVGPGRVLGDLIDSGVVPVTKLTEIRRQAKGSAIAEGAQAVREGRMPVMDTEGTGDFVFFEIDDDRTAEEKEQRLATKEAAETAAMLHDAFARTGADVQLLTPGHEAESGTKEMNAVLQAAAGHEGEAVRIADGCVARVNDRVIQLENDKDLDVYNGDNGVVIAVKDGSATIQFGDRTVEMGPTALLNVGLSYALTVHKAQGSECDVVIMILTRTHYALLRRTLFYTGLTRAKKKCIIVGTKSALKAAIANDDARTRNTTLGWRLRAMAGK